jgi:hypothetical protein
VFIYLAGARPVYGQIDAEKEEATIRSGNAVMAIDFSLDFRTLIRGGAGMIAHEPLFQ